ncbi:MAG TPA: acetone carboxylase subunit gamma [Steroidobacter sp.]|nr:acetone carboxylase subunit gamma [Steroidobacter sp.]
MTLSLEDLADLIDGRLPWPQVKAIVSAPKDDDRFQRLLGILQGRVKWPERILLPLGDHLYIVEKGDQRVVKCDCGQEFGDWRSNWKLQALVLVRDDEASLQEIWPGRSAPDAKLCEVREYLCPGCATLLKVEATPFGYPIIFDALPDLDVFYREWLGAPLAHEIASEDQSLATIRQWSAELKGSIT